MSWKIGDKLRFVEEIGDCDTEVFTIDHIYEIVDDENDGWVVLNDNGRQWVIQVDAFELVKKIWKPCKTEFEFLDRVKRNFKDGV